MTRITDALKTFVLVYPLSLLVAVAVGNWLPVLGDRFYAALSFALVLEIWFVMALVCLPSGLVFLLALFAFERLRRAPFPLQVILLAAIDFAPWIAAIRVLESVD